MRTHRVGLLAVTALALGLGGCATTTFTSSWKAPDAQPLQFKPGDKVVALVLTDNEAIRRSGEANLADELDRRGMVGIPGYTLIPGGEERDEAKARAGIEAQGAVGVIVMRPRGQEEKVTVTGGYYSQPYYSNFWGGGYGAGYYGYGWGGMYVPPQVYTDTYVSVETLVYDLRQNKLVWAGQTKSLNPSDVETFVGELATAISAELRSQGLVGAR
jgi:hypothetical protein